MTRFALLLKLVVALVLSGMLIVTSQTNSPIAGARPIQAAPPQVMRQAIQGAQYDWPQVQNNPQRTGYSPEILGTNLSNAWTYVFQREKVYPQVQAIVYQGRVYVGTEMGNVYALNAATGQQVWKRAVGSPVLASVAAAGGRVFFGAMDGAVYALDASTGNQIWKMQLSSRQGFSASPVYADNKVMLGGRNGTFYGLDPTSGQVLWQYNVGAPILQTVAWNNGRAYFGAMNMHLYAINSSNGSLAWKSAKLPQMALNDYWPVATGGRVILRPTGYGQLASTSLSDAAQTAALSAYDANPTRYSKSLFVFNEATGQEMPAVIHWDYFTMNGAATPPCVDKDGYLIVPAILEGSDWDQIWGRLNLNTRKMIGTLDTGSRLGRNPQDQSMNLTCVGNGVLALEGNEDTDHGGMYFYSPPTWRALPSATMSNSLGNWTMGGGGNPASVANGMFYHIVQNTLIARKTQ